MHAAMRYVVTTEGLMAGFGLRRARGSSLERPSTASRTSGCRRAWASTPWC